ncbi:MAG: LptF/LptG family permease [Pyrinomonadaceae bacterium]
MKRTGWLISKYLVTTIVPYFAMSWLLLSVILFVQQAGRFSDIFFSVNIPANLVWQLTIALVPNVIAFTCPMAILVGTIIGLTKMQGDSELVAIRASGVGNLQIALPIMLLGVLLSIFAFFVNLKGVPIAATLVRNVALQTAIKKLESPLEPGVFNTEVAGYTIYVRGGDLETGRWKNLFIYSEDKANKSLRLITSTDGRIDTTGQASELVLENASVTTLPASPGAGKYVSENIDEVRLAIRTSRSDLIDKLGRSELTPEELGLQQLTDYAASKTGKERVEAQILQNRRVILSISPFLFCLLGTVIVLRLNRGGRNFGILLALAVLIGYYLLAFLGEQLARTGAIAVTVGTMIPLAGSLLLIAWFSFSRRLAFWSGIANSVTLWTADLGRFLPRLKTRNLFVDLTTGLRDFDLIRNLVKNFLLTLGFLSAIFIIFTAFELWKFAGTIDGGIFLLAKYLTYLLPFMYLQIAPSAAMIATLATYVIKSRQNEIVTWTSAGQSVYRLLTPCFLLMILLGAVNWIIQERVLPGANQMQDAARTLIRNRGVPPADIGKYWVATDGRIYSFRLTEDAGESDNEIGRATNVAKASDGSPGIIKAASDNEKDLCPERCVHDLTVYEMADNGVTLQAVYRAKNGFWRDGTVNLVGSVERSELKQGRIVASTARGVTVEERSDPFAKLREKPGHLDSARLEDQIGTADSEVERLNLVVALTKKRTTLFLPLVMALFTAPFSLSLSRKGKAATVGYAVGLWLLFTGTSSVFEQFGLNAMLSPTIAVWAPLVIFGLCGVFLLSKVRT